MELTIGQALHKGNEAYKNGKVQEADRYYTAILKVQPNHPDANHNMGVLSVGIGKSEIALPFFKKALESKPNIIQFWLSYIDVLIKLDKLDEARSALSQAKSKNLSKGQFSRLKERIDKYFYNAGRLLDPPQDKLQSLINLYNQKQNEMVLKKASELLLEFPRSVTLLNIVGATNQRLGNLEKAKESFIKAIELYPNNAQTYNNLGNVFKDQKNFSEAIIAYENAISIKPNYVRSHYNIGTVFKRQGKLDKALENYDRAISIKPDYTEAILAKGKVFEDQGKLEEAIEVYKKVISINPNFVSAYINMGNAFKEQSNFEAAIKAYYSALSIDPNFSDAYYNLGNVLGELGKLEEAIEAYNKAVSIKPDCPGYYNLGNSLKDQGRLEEAILAYKKAVNINPSYYHAHNNMGIVLEEQGKLEEAAEAYNRAISIKPDYPVYYNLGNTLKEQGKLEGAINAFNKALSIKPDYAEAFNNLGITLHEQGKFKKAIEAFQKALSIKPDYSIAKHTLSALIGDTPKTAPREYVEGLFDKYAKEFDKSLLEKLEYKTPSLITDILLKLTNNSSLGSILDLGCGTGLLGEKLKAHCSKLEGIDLSKKMLKLAEQKQVYDKLSHVDITDYLSNSELNFDYYISLDVFIYVGDLSEIFHLIKSKNQISGKLVFSTEHTNEGNYNLLPSGRYAHSKGYISSLCKQFDYEMLHFSTSDLRKEKSVFIEGGHYILGF